MMGRSAANTAITAWGYSAPALAPDWRAFVLGFPLAAAMAFGPDIDHPNSHAARIFGRNTSKLARKAAKGHRGGMHSAPMVLAVAVLSMWLLYDTEWCAWAAGIGWASHIFTDLLTKQGVRLLWPLGTILGALWKPLKALDRKVRIAWFTTGSKAEVAYNVIVLIAFGVLIVEWVNLGIDNIARSMA